MYCDMTLFQFLSFVTFRHYNLLSIFLVGAFFRAVLYLHVIATRHAASYLHVIAAHHAAYINISISQPIMQHILTY